ncbi:hypothetical protein [Subtercola boreus]|uniref:Uncharacterized protein n=1 Tax=Subtercola boreus TaxID=120213 RepID=A0A3E0WDU5_9MICO|nr:hypothetical protein [Subtercola boreus]RFA21861.1 hypothetical protein B7R24_06150 [Subtercola boreus]RFA21972.1 hypothetical protein B7R23_06095 [Subtercola boreus]RFA27920.1 hypothetical protein B7R25_06220 [Subtercola boreus]
MTLNNSGPPSPDAQGPRTGAGKKPKVDQDIRNHPLYKTPWWRKPLSNRTYWIVFSGGLLVVIAAIVVCLSLGIALF